MNRTFPAVSHLAMAAAGVLLAACSDPPTPAAVVKPVFVTTVTEAVSSQTRSFTSVVRARVETDLGFRTGGKVVDRLVEVGDVVKAGQALARLDPADYQLAVSAAADQVQAASVDAQQAASDEARLRRLLADGSVGAADHERQKARADAAAARLEQARRQLDLARNREGYATLVAPYAGVITALRFERGQVVAEGQPVLSLARDGEREIVADLPEEWVGRVRTLAATATPWHDTKSSLRLVLRELSPLASAQGRTFRVRYAAAPESRAAGRRPAPGQHHAVEPVRTARRAGGRGSAGHRAGEGQRIGRRLGAGRQGVGPGLQTRPGGGHRRRLGARHRPGRRQPGGQRRCAEARCRHHRARHRTRARSRTGRRRQEQLMKRFNLSEWAVTHRPMVLFLIIATLIVGGLSFSRLGRLEDPNFDVPQMTAIVVWPGATAQDVQDQVLNRIERRLQELDHFEYVRSFARQGYGGITLWMKGGSSKAELDNAWYQARKKIGDVRQEFPDGVRGPFFNDEYNDRYSVLYALSAPDLSMAELLAVTEDVKRRIQGVPGVAKVDVLGKQAERVYVELSTPAAGRARHSAHRGVRCAGAPEPGGPGRVRPMPRTTASRCVWTADCAAPRTSPT